MIICKRCLGEIAENIQSDGDETEQTEAHELKFCPYCGAALEEEAETSDKEDCTEPAEADSESRTESEKEPCKEAEVPTENEKILALFSYVWVLVFIPLIAGRKSLYVKFHADQGIVLLVLQLAYWAAYVIFTALIFLISYKLAFIVIFFGIAGLGFFVLIIWGMINAAKGRTEKLPIIGSFS